MECDGIGEVVLKKWRCSVLSEASVGKLGDTRGQTGRDGKMLGVQWCTSDAGGLGEYGENTEDVSIKEDNVFICNLSLLMKMYFRVMFMLVNDLTDVFEAIVEDGGVQKGTGRSGEEAT